MGQQQPWAFTCGIAHVHISSADGKPWANSHVGVPRAIHKLSCPLWFYTAYTSSEHIVGIYHGANAIPDIYAVAYFPNSIISSQQKIVPVSVSWLRREDLMTCPEFELELCSLTLTCGLQGPWGNCVSCVSLMASTQTFLEHLCPACFTFLEWLRFHSKLPLQEGPLLSVFVFPLDLMLTSYLLPGR